MEVSCASVYVEPSQDARIVNGAAFFSAMAAFVNVLMQIIRIKYLPSLLFLRRHSIIRRAVTTRRMNAKQGGHIVTMLLVLCASCSVTALSEIIMQFVASATVVRVGVMLRSLPIAIGGACYFTTIAHFQYILDTAINTKSKAPVVFSVFVVIVLGAFAAAISIGVVDPCSSTELYVELGGIFSFAIASLTFVVYMDRKVR